jgi:glycosyltransferase involved in cell wall biosynthesis
MKKKLFDELSLFFPCYNEEANLENTFNQTFPVLQEVADKYEIIIVNDGSKDKTGDIAESLAKKYPSVVKVVTHSPNRGYGAAFKSGFYNAKYNWITFIDADGQFDFKDIYQLAEKQQTTKADVVVGYYLGRKVPFIRIWGSKVWQLCVFILFGLKVTDIDCGFKLVNKKVIETIPKLEAERGPFITSEFLVKAKKSGYKIVEVGVHHYPRHAGEATGAKLNVILSGLRDLVRLWFKLNFQSAQ